MIKPTAPLRYLVLSLGWLVFAWFASRAIGDGALWVGLLVTFLFAGPVYVAAIYAVTVRKIYRASQFNRKGWLHWLATGRLWAFAWRALWSLGFAFLMLFYLAGADRLQWLAVAASVPALFIIYRRFTSVTAREFKSYIAVQQALGLSRWSCAVIMAAAYVLMVWAVNVAAGGTDQPLSIAAAIQLATLPGGISESSVLLAEAARLVAWYQGIQIYALGNLQQLDGWLWLLCVYAGAVAFFYNLALGLSGFIVPAVEYRRILAPLEAADQPPPLTTASLVASVALVTFFTGFIYLPLASYLEHWLRANPGAVQWLHLSETAVVEKIEQIENDYYRAGTLDEIRQAQLALINQLDISLATLRDEADAGFDEMVANVDGYLDWYYSLPSEYGRIAALLSGSLERTMTRQLERHLLHGDAFARLQESLENTLKNNEQLRASYQASVAGILARNAVATDVGQAEILESVPLDVLLEPPVHSGMFDLENRLLIAGGTGAVVSAVSVVVASKVAAKVAGKGTIKLGAKALAKVAANKATGALGGTAAGAAAGAAAGSVVPGVGTVIGGVVGGVVGAVVIGLTVDQLLLMLEESYSRDEFRQQIIDEIEASRAEFMAGLGAAGVAPDAPAEAVSR